MSLLRLDYTSGNAYENCNYSQDTIVLKLNIDLGGFISRHKSYPQTALDWCRRSKTWWAHACSHPEAGLQFTTVKATLQTFKYMHIKRAWNDCIIHLVIWALEVALNSKNALKATKAATETLEKLHVEYYSHCTNMHCAMKAWFWERHQRLWNGCWQASWPRWSKIRWETFFKALQKGAELRLSSLVRFFEQILLKLLRKDVNEEILNAQIKKLGEFHAAINSWRKEHGPQVLWWGALWVLAKCKRNTANKEKRLELESI